jgi:hypothetical protein
MTDFTHRVLALLADKSTFASVGSRTDRSGRFSCDVVVSKSFPAPGLCTYCTVGMSDHALHFADGRLFPGRQEVLGLSEDHDDGFENVLFGIAISCVSRQRVAVPGEVFADMVSQACPFTTTPHALVTDPFAWDFSKLVTPQGTCFFVAAIPISSGERSFLSSHGEQGLLALLETSQIDVADLRRKSVV